MYICIHCVTLYSASVSVEEFRSDVAHVLLEFRLLQLLKQEEFHISQQSTMASILLWSVCIYTSSDVMYKDINLIIEAKQVTGSTTGLLISNQPTIPSECLLTLEDAGCQFVPVSGYGEEGWEDRMVDKFKDVFPKVPDDDSEVSSSILTVHCTRRWST